MPTMKIYQVDAFTKEAFKGNPAAVMILNEAMEEPLMQNIAAEMNLAETAFVYPQNDGYNLRWFTPEKEIKLCGHATLATAHILWKEGFTKESKLNFYTLSGLLTAEKKEDKISLDFPAIFGDDVPQKKELVKEYMGLSPVEVAESGKGYLVVELENTAAVKKYVPNDESLLRFGEYIIIITARDNTYDFISRVFGPAFGISEDPVTGSAHCMLATYWGNKLGKETLKAYQASKRGGEINLIWDNDRVQLIGNAVSVLHGEILV